MNSLRPLWISVGLVAVALGCTGIVLPLLPTTPFVLLAAFCFARGSPRLHDWLLAHRQFGPIIENWRRHGAISRRVKFLSVGALAAAFLISLAGGFSGPVLIVQAVTLGLVGLFILSRPETPRAP